MNILSRSARWVARQLGYNLVRCQAGGWPVDFDGNAVATIEAVKPFTKTSPERIQALSHSVRHIVETGVPGAFVECGVWRGGSMMAVARTLIEMGVTDRDLYLFDTYEGMSAPTDLDVGRNGVTAESKFQKRATGADTSTWCLAGIEDVRANMLSTGYPESRIHFVKGKVEDTLPHQAPEHICLLRLDTDWYESTKHEMEHLYPRLTEGGFLIIDDYGDWLGARKAVDEYLSEKQLPLFLHRVDDTARLAVKPASGRAAA
ncbi:MAG: class I SAM-dependent methyltransferase [Planctomycetaceae bacterium]|nr:class I SAM-dependent methyltransferase [Planctomycetaceae bacterium]